MLIDFNDIKEVTIPGMNNGTGTMTAKVFMDEHSKVISCSVHLVPILYYLIYYFSLIRLDL